MIAGFQIQENKNKYFGSDKAHKAIGSEVIGFFEIGNISLKLYGKAFVSSKFFVEFEDKKVSCVGILFYENYCLEEALSRFIIDYYTGKVNWNSLSGTYAILIWCQKELEIILDTFVVQSVFICRKNKIIGTSFLGILDSDSQFSLNNDAILETILTGNLIGPETLINEVERIEKDYQIKCFNNVKLTYTPNPDNIIVPKSREEAASLILGKLRKSFSNISTIANDSGLVTGITGGLDSRLILALAVDKISLNHIGVYTNCRTTKGKEKVVDEPIAEKVALSIGKKLKPAWMVHPLDLTEDEFSQVTHNSFLLFDGQVRMHVQFFEQYNNSVFKKNVHNDCKFGLSGIGGELFRNHDGMVSRYWTKDKFIKYYLVKNFVGDCFLTKEGEKSFFNRLDYKISKVLKFKSDKVYHKDLKKYYNLILVPYRLGIRNNSENRLFHFYSPFIDPSTVYQGFENVNYLGSSISFEKDLICELNKNLSNVELDYGIKPIDKVSFSLIFKPYVRNAIPDKLYVNFRINELRKPFSYSFERNMNAKFLLFRESINEVRNLNLQINIDVLLSSQDTMPIIFNLGYFLIRFKNKNYFENLKL